MKIDREINGDVAVLTLRGEFDSFVVNSFLEEVESLAVNGVRSVVLDMRGVKFIMSTAIGAIVKSRKKMKEFGGDLVIAQPSGFVRDVLDSLGLTRVIRVFDDSPQAVEALGQALGADLPAGNNALLHFTEKRRQDEVGKPVIGRVAELKEDGMCLQVPFAATFFAAGVEVRTKFRLPLFKKAFYFEIPARVTESNANDEGARLQLRFERMAEDDRRSIRQFLSDMQYLRDEVRNAGE